MNDVFGILLATTPWGVLGEPNKLFSGLPFSMGSAGVLLRRGGIALSFLAIAVSVVKLLIYHDAKSQAELKENIKHKVYVIILITSLVTLFTLMKSVFDSAFGF